MKFSCEVWGKGLCQAGFLAALVPVSGGAQERDRERDQVVAFKDG